MADNGRHTVVLFYMVHNLMPFQFCQCGLTGIAYSRRAERVIVWDRYWVILSGVATHEWGEYLTSVLLAMSASMTWNCKTGKHAFAEHRLYDHCCHRQAVVPPIVLCGWCCGAARLMPGQRLWGNLCGIVFAMLMY